jgi:hypothetical protein
MNLWIGGFSKSPWVGDHGDPKKAVSQRVNHQEPLIRLYKIIMIVLSYIIIYDDILMYEYIVLL